MFTNECWKDYELLDATNGERLERWGKYILIRPDPLQRTSGGGTADSAAACLPVGRVASNKIKRSSCKNAVCFPYISADNMYALPESVERRAALRKVRAGSLDLQSREAGAVGPVGQQNGDNAVSRSQVQTPPGLFHLHIGSKQNGVHSKAESGGILDDPQPALLQAAPVFPLEIIDPLSRAE